MELDMGGLERKIPKSSWVSLLNNGALTDNVTRRERRFGREDRRSD